ncbi:MAG: hypothetical protein HYV16_13900 [Gammaproteobacteria bacterium]|nr:hypothetical protein [Gammaproteobacteria bacterium]
MRKMTSLWLACGLALGSGACLATSATSNYFINQIVQGGPVTLRDVAKSIYQSGERDREVLDTLAEAVAQRAPTAADNTSSDAVAWSCKALAQSGDKRYYTLLKQTADKASQRAIRKHCDKAADGLGGVEGEQYSPGMAKLELRQDAPGQAGTRVQAPANALEAAAMAQYGAPAQAAAQQTAANLQPITVVRHGMSLQQVYDLCGMPMNTTSYQTGKAWNPFNVKGKDVMRTAALYKGQGRIVFANESAYSGGMRVVEVLVNANESGYP